MNEKFCIVIRISLKIVAEGSINNKSPFVRVMAWRRTGDNPLPEATLTHMCNTKEINSLVELRESTELHWIFWWPGNNFHDDLDRPVVS